MKYKSEEHKSYALIVMKDSLQNTSAYGLNYYCYMELHMTKELLVKKYQKKFSG